MREFPGKMWAFLGAFILILSGVEKPLANGQEVIVRLFVPAVLAEQFAQMCQQVEPTFLTANSGEYGTSSDFLDHVKAEVFDGLPEERLKSIVEITMDVVRQARRYELSLLSGGRETEENARVKNWCQMQVKPFLTGVFQAHTSHHNDFLTILKNSKR